MSVRRDNHESRRTSRKCKQEAMGGRPAAWCRLQSLLVNPQISPSQEKGRETPPKVHRAVPNNRPGQGPVGTHTGVTPEQLTAALPVQAQIAPIPSIRAQPALVASTRAQPEPGGSTCAQAAPTILTRVQPAHVALIRTQPAPVSSLHHSTGAERATSYDPASWDCMSEADIRDRFTGHENYRYPFNEGAVLAVDDIFLWRLPAADCQLEAIRTNINVSWLPDTIREGFITE
jgi:hypothetical protein